MKLRNVCVMVAVIGLLGSATSTRAEGASASEVEELKRALERQEQSIRELRDRINELEGERAPATPSVAAPPAPVTKPGEAPSPVEEAEAKLFAKHGHPSPVRYRRQHDDKQTPAPRPEDFTFDPEYRGFIPIPRTAFLIKFNPKPRLDMTFDTDDSGNDFRFVTADIPVSTDPSYGGGERFNANGNGSQLRLDIRAPTMEGNLRFYYQNDFFGSDSSNFRYRLQHLYGQAYGLVLGYTYGIFEDPDAWPDTLDYEGPNAVVFARRPLLHYTFNLPENLYLTLGVEDPDAYIDTTGYPDASNRFRAPDTGFNVRWTPGELGHLQFSSIFRSLGVHGDGVDNQDVFGWGIGLSGSLNVTENDTLQFWGVYGNGVGGMGNDTSFENSDAAFDSNGDLEALEYVSAMVAFSHNWSPRWRSTATYGYANLENTGAQDDDAYDYTHYASLNLVYKLFKRFSIGAEGLYGFHQVNSGADGDVFRFQVSAVYSLFD